MRFLTATLVALTSIASTSALSPAGWRSQSIYQVLTDRFALTSGSTTATCVPADGIYCGGSFQGIINHLSYIQGMGFTAIWISPVVENLAGNSADGEAYHGYWAQNIYEINSNFGVASDLVALSAALHARGMYLMVDVVANHMGYLGCGTCVDYSVFTPFNEEAYFHPFCLIDYSNATSILDCWEGDNIVSLPDLRTESADVYDVWNSWITALVANYTIDGLRVDSAEETGTFFFPAFQTAAGVYVVGEVFNGNPAYTCPYQEYMDGVLNYPAYYWITQAFESTSGSISNLVNGINTMISDCLDTTLLGSFLENHDNPRFPSLTSDISLTKNAIAFTILADGIPIIYEGQEQHYSGGSVPLNREAIWLSGYSTTATFYTWIATINQIRNQAIYVDSTYVQYKAVPVYSDTSTIMMRKGNAGAQIVGVFSNLGASGASYTLTLTSNETGFTDSQALVEVTGCTSYTTDSSGNLAVAMAGGLPRIFYPEAHLVGSGICSAITGSSSTSTTTKSTTSKTSTSTSISTTSKTSTSTSISTTSKTSTSTSTSTTSKTSTSTSTSTTSKTSTSTSTSTPCASATAVAVTFDELVTTVVGETIKIAGDVSALGDWDTSSAIALSASSYTSSDPLWDVTLSFTPGEVIEYKFINVASDGTVTWEADPDHTYTVPASCATAVTVSSSWQT